MIIYQNGYAIQCRRIESLNSLESILATKYPGSSIILRGHEEQACYLLEFRTFDSRRSTFAIAVIQDDDAAPVRLLPLATHESVILAWDCSVCRVFLPAARVTWQSELDGGMIVYAMSQIDDAHILVVCEIGACLMTLDGQVVWTVSRDVVTDYYLSDAVLTLQHSDAPPMKVELRTGKTL